MFKVLSGGGNKILRLLCVMTQWSHGSVHAKVDQRNNASGMAWGLAVKLLQLQ